MPAPAEYTLPPALPVPPVQPTTCSGLRTSSTSSFLHEASLRWDIKSFVHSCSSFVLDVFSLLLQLFHDFGDRSRGTECTRTAWAGTTGVTSASSDVASSDVPHDGE